MQSTIHTDIERAKFGRGMTAFWRRIVSEPDAFLPEFWLLSLQSSVTALWEKIWPVCVGVTWTTVITAEAMRQWRCRG